MLTISMQYLRRIIIIIKSMPKLINVLVGNKISIYNMNILRKLYLLYFVSV